MRGSVVEIIIQNQKSRIKNWKEKVVLKNETGMKVGNRRFVRINIIIYFLGLTF